ncbi:DUF6884 domain-containing protein [Kitasatospora phosalacinea]|uniref:DUF6884 domain-containing protein n=1 Tax=Kitasatospora phosalacinea TaxID=2065 RepID=A0A9W6PNV4_9ACTN|nr:DUF6884 domain-containing protein [Kitasatospora phosalacinea]GLW58147.1 hypothetical protein Kpho01_61580 [Kitasatospora phosalacinea]
MPIPSKLAAKPHEAVIAAAGDPNHQVPNRFNARTYQILLREGLAYMRPFTAGGRTYRYEELFGPPDIHLTAAGRAYAQQHGVDTPRRRIVVISDSTEKVDPGTNEAGRRNALPAGELYCGRYHRLLHAAADALTAERGLIYIVSDLHGFVEPNRMLLYYDVRLGDERSVSASTIRDQARRLALDDADVIVLGERAHIDLITAAVPHALAPLTNSVVGHRFQGRAVGEDDEPAKSWWEQAGQRFEEHREPPPATPRAGPNLDGDRIARTAAARAEDPHPRSPLRRPETAATPLQPPRPDLLSSTSNRTAASRSRPRPA